MPFNKIAQAKLMEPSITVGDWEKMHGSRAFRGCRIDGDHPFCKTASMQKIAAASSKYLLSHATIMASVQCELPPQDWLIKPECSHLCNSNDDAWENQTLKLSAPSFVGAFNFVEHWQNSAHAKGHILSQVLRKIRLTPEVWVYFCDILVATDLTHEKLIDEIRNDKVRYLSMGCVTDRVTCSYCGTHVTDVNTYCSHLQFMKGTFLADENGIPRRIAELCGGADMPNGGVKFVEASWVATPAFPGAVKRNIVAESWEGPKTRFTQAAKEASFAKAASSAPLADILLDADFRGGLRR